MSQEKEINPTQVVGYYHSGDADGFTGAWVLNKFNPNMVLEGVDYHLPLPEFPRDAVVYIVDYCFSKQVMRDLVEANKLVVLLDHHPLAEEVKEDLGADYTEDRFIASVTSVKSGCEIAWDFLFAGVNTPPLVTLVGDHDLWKFEQPETKVFTEGLKTLDHTFANWDYANTKEGFDDLMAKGKALLEERIERCRKQIEETTVKMEMVVDFKEDGTPITKETPVSMLAQLDDASHQTNLMIEAGLGELVMAMWKQEDGSTKVRVTTHKDYPYAGDIAKLFGGGGHPHAAGFFIGAE